MDEKDLTIQEQRREIADLKAQLAQAKAIQRRLFKYVPSQYLALLAREYPEMNHDR